MITPNKPVHQVSRIYQNTAARRPSRGEATASSDAVSLSKEGRELQAVLQSVSSAADIRPIAEELRTQVQSGTYQVSSKQIAAALLSKLGVR
ncbi:MAG: flagellar biosynthesis anti-sigma factor FlgM [Firmicutes bacterium]|nr:flagellar biosynthesis anti-sigma factor FlgM [Bacillota bacterium]